MLKIIALHFPITNDDIALCKEYIEPIVYPKNRLVDAEGKVPRYIYFVVSGFMRLFHFNDNGDEITTHINCPPGFITPYSDFVNETKTADNVECITDCELLRISKVNLDLLTQKSSAFRDFSIWVFQQSIAYNEKRAKMLATLNAEQRYRKLIDEYPEILHHVPVQYIASFLGMKAESLSRIRRQMIN
ncbi:MAG: Crp/Fnr family transcriptional regulator [Chitinophagales bacterium]|nr:Crp/Fnr family transcriptional regulator [Chitinophagales bacterium]